MGAIVRLQALDGAVYRRDLLPAYRALVERREVQPLLALLRIAVERAPAENRRDRLHSIARKVAELRAQSRGDDPDTRALIASSVLRELDAGGAGVISRGDAVRAMELLEDPHVGWDEKVDHVRQDAGPGLVDLLCVRRDLGVPPALMISAPALAAFLRSRSRTIGWWLEGGASGDEYELSTGGAAQAFTRSEVNHFARDLDEIGDPAGEGLPPTLEEDLRRRVDELRIMVRAVLDDVNLELAYVVS